MCLYLKESLFLDLFINISTPFDPKRKTVNFTFFQNEFLIFIYVQIAPEI